MTSKNQHISRRNFLSQSAAVGSLALMPMASSEVSAENAVKQDFLSSSGLLKTKYDFKTYRDTDTLCPVYRITPDNGYYLHTFYDVCPWSPSQRYLACMKFPFQDREPLPTDAVQICLIDMKDHSLTEVYSSRAWGFQLGANLQWGSTDRHLYFNDRVDGEVVCVRLDLQTGKAEPLAGQMYHIAPDESAIVSYPLELINASQVGYGYAVDPAKAGPSKPINIEKEGIWRTDLKTGKKKLLVSLAEAFEVLPDATKDRFRGGKFHFFHSKYNPQSDKLLQVFRCMVPDTGQDFGVGGTNKFKPSLVTFNADGSDVKLALSSEVWGKGGHHPNWHPNGEEILMNLQLDYEKLKFCSFRHDGSDFKVLSETIHGSGHPSFHKNGRYMVSDVYPEEYDFSLKSKEVPIRFIDLKKQIEKNLCFIYTRGLPNADVLRIDPHVVWNRDYTKVCFNASPEGRRQLFVADVSELLKG